MLIGDYEGLMALWQNCDGMGLSDADSRDGISGFLERNPGLSFVAVIRGEIVGTSLCGHDGRRGFIYHLAVAGGHRRRGLARQLVEQSLAALEARGIRKCHIVVFADNVDGRGFWERIGWEKRDDLVMMSRKVSR
jgi:ribosomal protein S18 acetylase RimI-like enzyme